VNEKPQGMALRHKKNKISDVSIEVCQVCGAGPCPAWPTLVGCRSKTQYKPLKPHEASGGFSSRFVGRGPIQTGKNACPTYIVNQSC
jgi:hypothetical protein